MCNAVKQYTSHTRFAVYINSKRVDSVDRKSQTDIKWYNQPQLTTVLIDTHGTFSIQSMIIIIIVSIHSESAHAQALASYIVTEF